MSAERHLTASQLEEILDSGIPRRLPVPGTPDLQLLIDAPRSGVWLLIPWSDGYSRLTSPLEEIAVMARNVEGARYLAIGSESRRLTTQGYAFLATIADEIQVGGHSVPESIERAVTAWRRLLLQAAILSSEEQIGLLGELWAVNRLVLSGGTKKIDAWLGPLAEKHDIRLPGIDLEVKTTTGGSRVHIISSLEQLTPSMGHDLYLLSIELQLAGEGEGASLPEVITQTLKRLEGDPVRANVVRQHLEGLGVRERHYAHYGRRYRLSSQPVVIRVDESFPAITKERLKAKFGDALAARVTRAQYVINVEGLGATESSSLFQALLPRPPEGDVL